MRQERLSGHVEGGESLARLAPFSVALAANLQLLPGLLLWAIIGVPPAADTSRSTSQSSFLASLRARCLLVLGEHGSNPLCELYRVHGTHVSTGDMLGH